MRRLPFLLGLVGVGGLAGVVIDSGARAADHQESPLTAQDPAADLGDLYAWHTDDSLVLAMTYAGYAMPNAEPSYDDGVLYTFHVSTDGDAIAEHAIESRFGQNATGDWGVSVRNVPGETEPLVGAVEAPIMGTRAMAYAGVRDDPFFFDLEGFQNTLTTGTLAFDAQRDVAFLQNTNAIVVELPLDALGGDLSQLRVWASTARKQAS